MLGRRIGTALIGAGAAFLLAVAAATGSADAVRLEIAPNPARLGQKVTVTARVARKPATCSGAVKPTTGPARTLGRKRSASGRVSWPVAVNAPGRWTVTVGCGAAGVAKGVFRVVAPPPPPIVPASVEVEASGLSQETPGSLSQVSFGAVLRNPSPDEDAVGVTITYRLVEADGTVRATFANNTTISVLPAGATYYDGGNSVSRGTPARVVADVRIQEHRHKATVDPPVPISITYVTPFGRGSIVGFDAPSLTAADTGRRISMTAFDASGAVVGGAACAFRPDVRYCLVATLPPARIASVKASVAPKPL